VLGERLARALPGFRDGDSLGPFRPVGGGCIHHAGILQTAAAPLFLKWNRGESGTGFTGEARSLEALQAAASPEFLDVPDVIDAADADSTEFGWLVLEYLPPSPPAPDHEERLGRGLAHLHDTAGERFGWPETNCIGPLPQPNPSRERWADFWVEARLLPQLRSARDVGLLDPGEVDLLERVAEATPRALGPVADDPPGLVHGDLWSGNVHPGPRGRPVLVDPAAYWGHGEVDLAMSRLFGGFGAAFYRAYQEIRPLADGFEAVRCPLYQLYYLLVHVRLFGGSYRRRTRDAARSVLAALG
jgi:fructosamine-3-kinase